MAGGAQPYSAGYIAHGVRDLLGFTPAGIPMAVGDFAHAKSQNDTLGTIAAAMGIIPGVKPELAAVKQGIRAFHGSPHDFEKFDISKIGTGEGAQAYGHGLYFAENADVAKEYRKNLAAELPHTIAGKPLSSIERSVITTYPGLSSGRLSVDDAIKWAEEAGRPSHARMLEEIKAKGGIRSPGHTYEVNINASPEKLLDWDKPLRDQSQHIQDFFQKQTITPRSKIGGPPNPIEDAHQAYDAVARTLASKYGSIVNARKVVSDQMLETGIPGIKYLDQGSRSIQELPRNSPQGWEVGWNTPQRKVFGEDYEAAKSYAQELQNNATRNYVIFDAKLVDILRKYGIALPAGGAALAAGESWTPSDAQAAQQPTMVAKPPLSRTIDDIMSAFEFQDPYMRRMKLPLQRAAERIQTYGR